MHLVVYKNTENRTPSKSLLCGQTPAQEGKAFIESLSIPFDTPAYNTLRVLKV
jgi:hypothetical protein